MIGSNLSKIKAKTNELILSKHESQPRFIVLNQIKISKIFYFKTYVLFLSGPKWRKRLMLTRLGLLDLQNAILHRSP
jgi:hypothetical protein